MDRTSVARGNTGKAMAGCGGVAHQAIVDSYCANASFHRHEKLSGPPGMQSVHAIGGLRSRLISGRDGHRAGLIAGLRLPWRLFAQMRSRARHVASAGQVVPGAVFLRREGLASPACLQSLPGHGRRVIAKESGCPKGTLPDRLRGWSRCGVGRAVRCVTESGCR